METKEDKRLVQLVVVVGVLLLLWQVINHPFADAALYALLSLLSILAFIVKSRF